MKFYRASRAVRVIRTVVSALVVFYGVDMLIEDHRWPGLLFLFLAVMQFHTLWTQYWEITPQGTLHSRGYGFLLTYQAADLRYAGPVREEHGFPVSRKKDIELEIDGVRAKRYVRVADRSAFLERLQQVAPLAEVVPV